MTRFLIKKVLNDIVTEPYLILFDIILIEMPKNDFIISLIYLKNHENDCSIILCDTG